MPLQTKIIKAIKITGIVLAVILLLLHIIPIAFPGTIAYKVKKIANERLDSRIAFSKSKLSFFSHFPYLTVSLEELSLSGSAPFRDSTFIRAEEAAFGINMKRLLFNNEVKIDRLYLTDASVNVMVNAKGQANYNIYVAPKNTVAPNDEGTAVKLERIDIENCNVNYTDASAKTRVVAKGLNYVGKGNLSEDIFDLNTSATINTVNLYYKNTPYLKDKKIRANLITRINTNSLSFILKKNELNINKLPLKFTGLLTILKDGYTININAASEKTTVEDLLSVLPPESLSHLNDFTITGNSDLFFTFKGNHNALKKQSPDLSFNLKVPSASLKYKNAVIPPIDLALNLNAALPSLDTRKLQINLNSLTFKLGTEDYFTARYKSSGYPEMNVNAKVKGSLDLASLGKALGLKDINLKGNLTTDIATGGTYSHALKKFPNIKGGFRLKEGEIKMKAYPNPITGITFNADFLNTAGTFQGLSLAVTPASFIFEGNPVYANLLLSDFNDLYYKADVKGELNIGNIYKVFSQKGLNVTGYAKADLFLEGKQSYATTGQYDKLNNKGTLIIRNIRAKSASFPKTFLIREGNFRFQNEKMWFEKFNANYGRSDFSINGYLLNTINYFLESRGTLSGNFSVHSKQIYVDEFMALKKPESPNADTQITKAKVNNPKMSGVVLIPENLGISTTIDADMIEYNSLPLTNCKGTIGINQGKVNLNDIRFNLIGCRVQLKGEYNDESPIAAHFKTQVKADDFDVKRAYNEIPMFRKLVSAAEKAEGIVSLNYEIKGDLNGNMHPIYASLEGGGDFYLRNVKIRGLKLLDGLSTKTGQNGFSDPDMKGIKISTSIERNLIRVHDFSFWVSGFKPSIKGTSSFDGLLDLRIRLGLPPLGIIGIPIVITGTHEDPKIKAFSKTGKEIVGAIYNDKTNTVIKKEKTKK